MDIAQNTAIPMKSSGPTNPADMAVSKREKALDVARQFEEVFVRTLVSAMRQRSELGGEQTGMFGSGPGADTYTDWFDKHMSQSLADTGGIGVADVLMREFERHKQIPPLPPKTSLPARLPGASLHGGFDVIG